MTEHEDEPTVLAVDDDEGLLGTYELWLDDDYDLRTATSGEAALAVLDEGVDVDVVLLDRLMPGLSGRETLAGIRERGLDVQVAMVTAVEPDTDVTDVPFDAYVTKALDRETVRETVETLLERRAYDDRLRECFALSERVATLETAVPAAELEDDPEYQELLERLAAVEDDLDRMAAEMDDAGFVAAMSGLEDRS
jgi:DNA-binding NtrC family response regulator